ncbi:NAD(P)-dependent oxidoreductase [Lysinibacillus sphaericus]|uniref:Nucleoside-diphosphate-sugar epimerase n=1 Tax=Lysinibacillus sphaericus OT4b.31 TaxID=1285586 RepID=R7ZCZ7_LYSSH|nr:SDR family oxidoreductase [Lysinibacillus sphaericus]EON71899.1 nucleoside-diphosphate-sugar epimerase [Lysinibacillus sphaericus OT4b.31]
MKILVLGATGRVGSHIVSLALRDGHHVMALVRTPNKISTIDSNLHIIHGNVLNQHNLQSVMSEIDIVISALNTDGTNTLSESMLLILETMKKANVKRIITVGTAGILQSRLTPHLLRYQSSESKRKTTNAAEEHHKVFDMLSQSDVDWTIVCPTYLPDGEYTGVYRIERNFLPEGGTKISVADTAEFTYQQSLRTDYLKSRVGIAY